MNDYVPILALWSVAIVVFGVYMMSDIPPSSLFTWLKDNWWFDILLFVTVMGWIKYKRNKYNTME